MKVMLVECQENVKDTTGFYEFKLELILNFYR